MAYIKYFDQIENFLSHMMAQLLLAVDMLITTPAKYWLSTRYKDWSFTLAPTFISM